MPYFTIAIEDTATWFKRIMVAAESEEALHAGNWLDWEHIDDLEELDGAFDNSTIEVERVDLTRPAGFYLDELP